ncbi:uncharacterized protein DS421_11g342740 [Arachis hypogaea]|nr:uncharacterized protein DS421_11g342740 [Arachis hypogaea]
MKRAQLASTHFLKQMRQIITPEEVNGKILITRKIMEGKEIMFIRKDLTRSGIKKETLGKVNQLRINASVVVETAIGHVLVVPQGT